MGCTIGTTPGTKFFYTISKDQLGEESSRWQRIQKTEISLTRRIPELRSRQMATTGLKWLQEKPIIPMDPDTIVQFYIQQERTITGDFKRTVCKMIQLAILRNFYYNRFDWSDNIFDAVDWDIFRPAYKKHIQHQQEYNEYTNIFR